MSGCDVYDTLSDGKYFDENDCMKNGQERHSHNLDGIPTSFIRPSSLYARSLGLGIGIG